MCGIIGYNGEQRAAPFLVEGLRRLEYRGYDSAGIATAEKDGTRIVKAGGRIDRLEQKLLAGSGENGTAGIGHTRWATHGEPTDKNAHPHAGMKGIFTIVHNGIIENYARLRGELEGNGTVFASMTDTETAVQLMEKYYDGRDCLSAILKALGRLEGSFAFGIMCRDYPDVLFCARNQSPLIVGTGSTGTHLASDISAIADRADCIYRLDDGEVAVLGKSSIDFFGFDGKRIKKQPSPASDVLAVPEKGSYEHFMLKEIFEQPEAVRATVRPHIIGGKTVLEGIEIKKPERVYITACGSAYHAGIVGKYLFEELWRIPVEVDLASEFRYRNPPLGSNTPVILISQSGETADTLAALREAKRAGAQTVSIVNVPQSSLARESDCVFYTRAGAEIAVATTKAYSAQLAALYLLGLHFALEWGTAEPRLIARLTRELEALPDKLAEILTKADGIKQLAESTGKFRNAYFIGRGIDYAAAMESSLKLKEISYIHSEAYAAGELKHGTISLIEQGTPVAALCCDDRVVAKTVSNIKEVKARGARTLVLTTKGCPAAEEADYTILLPDGDRLFSASLQVVPMQLFAYYTAKILGCDIDKPRNLAKSVTVE